MKLLFKITWISSLICLVVMLMNLIFAGLDLTEMSNLELWGTFFFYSFVLTAVNHLYFVFFEEKFGWEGASLRRVFFAATGSIVITLLSYFFCRLIDEVVFQDYSLEHFLENEKAGYYLFPLLFTTIVSLIFHLIYFYKALQERKVTEQKIIAGTASAKFESLKNQIDPHFLFNSLNVLTSLIEENPVQAQKFTTGLSKIYRYVLEQKDKELVGLGEELSFAVSYMNLLQMRFENSIFYDVPEHISSSEAKVVPLSLQLLLENTVKHNQVSENRPLRISIYEEENYLVLRNNLQKKEVLAHRKGVGLQNIVDRYQLVTRRKVLITENDDFFAVKIPILTKQIQIMRPDSSSEDQAYFRARQRVKEIKEFYGNVASYAVVIPLLIFINYQTYWGFQWFWFPTLGWGFGILMHALSVFGYGSQWEEKKIREIMHKQHLKDSKTWN